MHNSSVKLTYILYIMMLVFSFTNCKSKAKEPANAGKKNPPVVVDIIIAEKESMSNIIEANGTVIASEQVDLRPEVNGLGSVNEIKLSEIAVNPFQPRTEFDETGGQL